MAKTSKVTCQIRYTVNVDKLDAFETYARIWMALIEDDGGTHHGYFLPRSAPDGVQFSFPEIGFEGPSDVAIALFTFPDEASYQRYRELVAEDPECQAATALHQGTQCFFRYERLFLDPLDRSFTQASGGHK